jgi:hypothetical protein
MLHTQHDGSFRADGVVDTIIAEGEETLVLQGGGNLGVSLPLSSSADPVDVVEADTAIYRNRGDGYDVAVQATSYGARALLHISDPGAPTVYPFELDLAAGERLRMALDGGVDVVRDVAGVSVVRASIASPWAIDADGAEVRTWYELQGTTVVQHVDHAGARHPVVADPSVSIGWKLYVTFSRSEASRIGALPVQYTKYLAAVCVTVPNPAVAAACGMYLYDVLGSVANTFKTARSRSCEVEMQYLHGTATLVGWKTKNCRW